MSFKIATRKSKLALAQTDYVINLLTSKFKMQCEKVSIKTEGDRKLDVSLNKIGGKGVFVKDIEKVLMKKHAHAAVHSMKDMPNELLDFFEIIAMPVREDVRDVFISPEGISFSQLPKGALIGTSSIRRAVQIRSLRNDIEIVPMRG
ncbi:hydroxymethylbilane synthase, partial [Clostridium sp.]